MIHKRTALQKARKAKKMTQQQVAKQLGITVRAYQYYEYGDRNPPLDKAVELARLLDIQVDELLVRNYTTDSSNSSAMEQAATTA